MSCRSLKLFNYFHKNFIKNSISRNVYHHLSSANSNNQINNRRANDQTSVPSLLQCCSLLLHSIRPSISDRTDTGASLTSSETNGQQLHSRVITSEPRLQLPAVPPEKPIGSTQIQRYLSLISEGSKVTHHQVSNDHDQHEDEDAEWLARDLHAVPHGLNPLAAQHPEDNEEGVEEVLHVPARKSAVLRDLTHTVLKEEGGDGSVCWTYIHKSVSYQACALI